MTCGNDADDDEDEDRDGEGDDDGGKPKRAELIDRDDDDVDGRDRVAASPPFASDRCVAPLAKSSPPLRGDGDGVVEVEGVSEAWEQGIGLIHRSNRTRGP